MRLRLWGGGGGVCVFEQTTNNQGKLSMGSAGIEVKFKLSILG